MAQTEVRDNPAQSRYEIWVDGRQAGRAEYQRTEHIVFVHTEIDPAYAGQGLASTLVRGALDDVRARGEERVVARCPFVRAWLRRHPEYGDLVERVPV